MRTFTIGGLSRFGRIARYRLCDGGRRVAVWVRDEESRYWHLRIADAETGALVDSFEEAKSSAESSGRPIVCRDGRRLVYHGDDRRTWHYQDDTADALEDVGPVPSGFEPPGDTETTAHKSQLAASADGSIVAMVEAFETTIRERLHRTNRAEVWRVTAQADAPAPLARLDLGTQLTEPDVAVSGGLRPLVALGWGRHITVWDVNAAVWLPALPLPDYWDRRDDGLQFSDDGRRLVSHNGWRLWTWDTAHPSGVCLTTVGDYAAAVAVSPDGRTVATADDTGVVRSSDAATGAPGPALQLPRPDDPRAVPVGLSFSADGTMGLLGYSNGFVAIWDVE